MDERKFIHKLQERAQEQEHMLKAVPFPSVFIFVARWLSYHPWRALIPAAVILTIIFRLVLGEAYTNLILGFFRWWS